MDPQHSRTRRVAPTRTERELLRVAADETAPDVERAAAISRIARRKGTISGELAEIRRACIERLCAAGSSQAAVGARIGLTKGRIGQILAGHQTSGRWPRVSV